MAKGESREYGQFLAAIADYLVVLAAMIYVESPFTFGAFYKHASPIGTRFVIDDTSQDFLDDSEQIIR